MGGIALCSRNRNGELDKGPCDQVQQRGRAGVMPMSRDVLNGRSVYDAFKAPTACWERD